MDLLSLAVDGATVVLLLVGLFFFTAGTVGLLRLPDPRSQMHALTKADNVGLGLILAGVALQLGSLASAGVLILIWLLALGSASVSARLLGGIEAEDAELHPEESAPYRAVEDYGQERA